MNLQINLNSSRAIKARYRQKFSSKQLRKMLALTAVITTVFGVLLAYLWVWYGWLILTVPAVLLMLHEWYRHELRVLPPINSEQTPESLLSADTLGYITKGSLDQKDIIEVLKKNNGFWFMANRMLLHPDILSSISFGDNWWQESIKLWNEYPREQGIDGAHIIAAITLTSPDKQAVLSATHNTEDSIISGLKWYAYTQKLLASVNDRRDSGGIARDWAAGYTITLDTYAQNLSRHIQYGGSLHRDVIGHNNVIEQMLAVFNSAGRANIALVGEVGTGKSTCVMGFAEALLFGSQKNGLKYSQVYQVDISAILTQVPANQIEAMIQKLCAEAYHAKNIVLYFDNAGAFFGVDQRVDVTNTILPIIESGAVRMVFSFNPVDWQYMQRAKSQVVALLNYQSVQPTEKEDTLKILENQALFTEAQYGCVFSYESLIEVFRLADRYGPEIAMPGRAISVLEDTARSAQGKLVVKQDAQHAVEQTTGIKISTADTTEKDVLLMLESQLKSRVIGQDAAVRELVSALKRSRAGVSNPNKPIGTFLFLGPTGVGKTEMTKTLANVYFGGADAMVRVDMNEYITQDSVNKLLQGSSQYGTAFLESVRRRPFTVVLFDELEKAHPEIVNVLLQLLDEGEIKDSDNRKVSFKDAIVIATSNAGADVIRDKISNGVAVEEFEASLADDLIARGIFKPEFINRFDDVIIFAPLTQNELYSVVRVMLGDINTQLSAQGITVDLTDDAVAWLANQGYDERLGARPLRRMMQKTVETVVSDILLQQSVAHGSTITISADQLQAV
jgi:ATP-dependent Clp protease ATP-binding subunit ClpC